MSPRTLIAMLVLLTTGSAGLAHACVAVESPKKEDIAQWIEHRTATATYVFLARITKVITSGKIPALDTTVKFKVLEHFKGTPEFLIAQHLGMSGLRAERE
jgi:hypothetical protein